MKALRSLRLRLVCGLALASCLLWGGVALWRTYSLEQELNAMLDERLVASAKMVAGIVHQFEPAGVDVAARQAALHRLIARDGVACEVSLVRSEITPIARTGDTPENATQGHTGFAQITKGGKTWRVYVLEEDGLRIATADRLDQRRQLVRAAWLELIIPFALAISAVLLLTWAITTRALRPLQQLRQELRQHQPNSQPRLRAGADLQELAPVVASLNQLLARMEAAIAHERRWSADAAHELRTPLTAIKTHVQVAQMALAGDAAPARTAQSLAQATLGITQLEQTMEQLLQLARVESAPAPGSASTEGAQAIGQALAQARQQSQARARAEGWSSARIELPALPALPGHPGLALPLPPALLVCALSNLLDNALRHHQGPDPIQVTLEQHADGGLTLQVRDQGPGLTPDECQQASQRFWRKYPGTSGSGLGLTLVQRIAESAGGQLVLAPSHPGLCATLEFPAAGKNGQKPAPAHGEKLLF